MFIYLQTQKHSYPSVFYILHIIVVEICFLWNFQLGLIYIFLVTLAIFEEQFRIKECVKRLKECSDCVYVNKYCKLLGLFHYTEWKKSVLMNWQPHYTHFRKGLLWSFCYLKALSVPLESILQFSLIWKASNYFTPRPLHGAKQATARGDY